MQWVLTVRLAKICMKEAECWGRTMEHDGTQGIGVVCEGCSCNAFEASPYPGVRPCNGFVSCHSLQQAGTRTWCTFIS